MPLAVDSLTENSTAKEIREAIWKSTTQMTDEYFLNGSIGELILSDSEQAYSYARYEALKVARQKTGKVLPDK